MNNPRDDRCARALERVLEIMRKKGEPEAMKALRARFPVSASILEADICQLREEGLTETEAQLLTLIPNLARYSARSTFGEKPRLTNVAETSEYLKTLYIGLATERFYVLSLDSGGRLMDCRLLQEGTVDETPFYLGQLLKCVVSAGAAAIVLSHNHPGGTARASYGDIEVTLNALQALQPIGVPLLDHIIIARDETVSLRGSGTIEPQLWLLQDASSKLLKYWLKA